MTRAGGRLARSESGAEVSQYWDNGCAGGAKALEVWGE